MTPPSQSFRAWLRTLDDSELAELLIQRPDTAHPTPPNIDALATRLLLRTSIARALDMCTAQELAELEALALAGAELEPAQATDSAAAQALLAKGLIFSPSDAGFLIAPEVMRALPTDFSLLNQHAVSPQDIAGLTDDERAILETLEKSGIGTTRDAAASADPTRPVPRLIAKGLISRVDEGTVRLNRATRLAMHGKTGHVIPTTPSGRAGTPVEDSKANEAGASAVFEVIVHLGALIETLGAAPIELLKDKSVGVRHIGHLAKDLAMYGISQPAEVVRLINLGFHARLLGRGEPKGGPEGNFLAPTADAWEWSEASLESRAEFLLTAWKTSPWASWTSARALDPESTSDFLSKARAAVMDIYSTRNCALSTEEFWEDLRFHRPLFATHSQATTITELLHEAQWLGLVAHGRLTTARPLPQEIDAFIVQADCTVIAPGPLAAPILKQLVVLADRESAGLASVFRLSAQSIRRALDAGYTAQQVEDFLRAHGTTDLPQTVQVLIADSARHHGSLRAGAALCYVRSEDPLLISQAAAAVPELRVLAPTVAVSNTRLADVLSLLRDAGLSPCAEDDNGLFLALAPEPAVVPTPRQASTPAPMSMDFAHVVEQLRQSMSSAQGSPEHTAGSEVDFGLIEAAARGRRAVTITFVSKDGQPSHATVTPLSVSGGTMDALDAHGKPVRIPLARLSAVALAP